MQQMDKIQTFKPGTYVTNGNMSGIVKTYSLNNGYDVNDNAFSQFGKYIHLYIGFYRSTISGNVMVLRYVVDFNDESYREMNNSEINEFNQILLKNGYIWDEDSKKVIEMEATALKDNKKEIEMVNPKFKTGDFLTSIDGDTAFIFTRYLYDGWLLGWTMKFNNEEKRYNCRLEKFNPAHPWEYSTNYDKEIFLRRLKDTCYVWHNDVKEIHKEYELGDNKLKCGDIIHFRDGETVIFKEITDDKLKMRVWHAPADGNVLVEYNRYTPWRYATGDEQDYILDIMACNGYVWDKDENHFFSNPRMIKTNISDVSFKAVSLPNEIQPINIPDGYRTEIKNGTIYFFKEFKDGEFIKTKNGDAIAIFKEISDRGEIIGHVEYFRSSNEFLTAEDILGLHLDQWTYATDEDIKLFKEKLAEQNYKWDENKKELVKLFWTPNVGETYFFINRKFNVIEARNINNEVHQHRISLHNCFKTEEDATELLKEIKEMFVKYNKEKYGK